MNVTIHLTLWLPHDGRIHIGPEPEWPIVTLTPSRPGLFSHCLECAKKACEDMGIPQEPPPNETPSPGRGANAPE